MPEYNIRIYIYKLKLLFFFLHVQKKRASYYFLYTLYLINIDSLQT